MFYLYSDTSPLAEIFQNSIVKLCVNGKQVLTDRSHSMYTLGKLFSNILLMFTNLLHFKFYAFDDFIAGHVSFDQTPIFVSSTLVELHLNVYCLDDCLYLLDGRLPQLHTLFIKIFHIDGFIPSTVMTKVSSIEIMIEKYFVCFFKGKIA